MVLSDPPVQTTVTPCELRDGRWYKREDAHRAAYGVNGAKLRACQHLLWRAKETGADRVVSAASVLSPQSAMAAVTAAQFGLGCEVIVGSRNPETALEHPSMRIAAQAGAEFLFVPVGYNPYLQAQARERATRRGTYHLQYGITPPPDATVAELHAFHWTGAAQVANLSEATRTLVIPFGSGNSAAGVLYGLHLHPHLMERMQRIVLVGIGPDRMDWLKQRLLTLNAYHGGWPITHLDLHGSGFARYGDKMPEERDGITFHPTYEGKVIRFLDRLQPDWWDRRDNTTALWIVGGPLPKTKTPTTRGRP